MNIECMNCHREAGITIKKEKISCDYTFFTQTCYCSECGTDFVINYIMELKLDEIREVF